MDNQKLISVGDLFKKSIDFYKSKLYVIMLLALIPFANFLVISLLMEVIGETKNKVFATGIGSIVLLIFLVSLVTNLWVQVTYFYLIKEKDVAPAAKSLLAFSWNKIASYSWVLFLMGIISLAGFLLLIVPGIIFSVWFSLAIYVFVFEEVKGMPALYKSKDLVKGYWWPVLGRFFIFGLCVAIIETIPVIGNLINIFFAMPLGVIYGYFLYQNLKMIKEPAVPAANPIAQ